MLWPDRLGSGGVVGRAARRQMSRSGGYTQALLQQASRRARIRTGVAHQPEKGGYKPTPG